MRTARVFALAFPLVACAPSPSDSAPDTIAPSSVDVAAEERAIRDATQRWSSVARRGDTTGMYAIYADDGVWLRPGSIPMLNRDSLRAHLAGSVEPPPSDSLVQPQETMRVVVAKSGDLAYELGRFTNPAGAPVAGGFYIRVWRKDGGQWKLLATAPRAYAPDKGRLIAR